MRQDVRRQIATLEKMTVVQLRERHLELFGEENRASNRQYLFRRIAWRLQTLAEGDLSERARQRAAELARDADLRQTPPPGLTVPAAAGDLPRVSGRIESGRDERLPVPGTVLTRVYKGVEYRVTVLSPGFDYEGEMYRSLTAITHKITGCHWNGYYFFNLRKPERK
jgi:hypothetical protein